MRQYKDIEVRDIVYRWLVDHHTDDSSGHIIRDIIRGNQWGRGENPHLLIYKQVRGAIAELENDGLAVYDIGIVPYMVRLTKQPTIGENTMSEKAKTLAAKMASIMGKIERIKKAGRNEHFRYTFATSEDVSDTIRGLLAEESVAFQISMAGPPSQVTSERGNTRTIIPYTMRFIDGDNGEIIESVWYSEALDNQDKGINKTATAAVKYFLLKTFVMSSGDEVDTDREHHEAVPKSGAEFEKATQKQLDILKSGVEKLGKDWDKFAAYVASRSGMTIDKIDQVTASQYITELATMAKPPKQDSTRVKEKLGGK